MYLIKSKLIWFSLGFLLAGTGSVLAQEDETPQPKENKPVNETEVIPPFKPSLRGAFKLPNALANNSFKKIFNGVSNAELSYVYPFFRNFFAGAGIQHSYYDINRFSFSEVNHGNLQSIQGYAELGFQKYTTEKWYYMLGLRLGYSNVTVRCDNCENAGEPDPSSNMLFNEAVFGFYLHGNERMSYGLLLSYQLYHFDFNPSWICRTSIGGLTDRDYSGRSQSFTIGFGFTCILGKMPD